MTHKQIPQANVRFPQESKHSTRPPYFRRPGVHLLVALLVMCCGAGALSADDVLPEASTLFRRAVVPAGPELRWSFDNGLQGWQAVHHANLTATDGRMIVRALGDDPYIASPPFAPVPGVVQIEMQVRTRDVTAIELFWATSATPRFRAEARVRVRLRPDGNWHRYRAQLSSTAPVVRLRIDPGNGPGGTIEVDELVIRSMKIHPIEIVGVRTSEHTVTVRLRNHEDEPRVVTVGGRRVTVPPDRDATVSVQLPAPRYVNAHSLEVRTPGFPPLRRTVVLLNDRAPVRWLELTDGPLRVRVDDSGTCAELWHDGRRFAVMAPLAARGGRPLPANARRAGSTVLLEGDDFHGRLTLAEGRVRVLLTADRPLEGPVVRVAGTHERAVLPGLEYLGRGEPSSSTADIEGPEHIRYRPDPLHVTIPLMAVEGANGTVSLVWPPSTDIRPVFFVPNRLDGPPGHRMSLIGSRIEATIQVGKDDLDERILSSVHRLGLPELPRPPRDREQQVRLCLRAINGVLWNGSGWGHCAEPKWQRRPFADFASTLFWATGRLPELPQLVPGGSHLRNDTAFFVSGRAREWLRFNSAQVRRILQEQQADGSFRYQGPMARTHFEDTASGYCAARAVTLLRFARRTGDRKALEAGLRTLEFMKRFRTPRGAQTWEIPLHTPDVLAAAHLVNAYVLGFELTGNREYRDLAVRWAVRGLPFVYLWSCRPIMAYSTIAVFGATHWKSPVWIGRPVQWCGLVYADSLRKLAAHDDSLDWLRLARGILIAAQQMQYPNGEFAGCLPDSIDVDTQMRYGPAINPCAIMSLTRRLDRLPDDLTVLRTGKHVVLGPFPMSLAAETNTIIVHSRRGIRYELLLDGERTLTVEGTGRDSVAIGAASVR